MGAGNVHCALSGASQPSTANPSAPNTPSAARRSHGWDAKMDSEALSASSLDSGVSPTPILSGGAIEAQSLRRDSIRDY
jgi:hypothetical protein